MENKTTRQDMQRISSLLGNLIVDLVYGLVDPRVRVNK